MVLGCRCSSKYNGWVCAHTDTTAMFYNDTDIYTLTLCNCRYQPIYPFVPMYRSTTSAVFRCRDVGLNTLPPKTSCIQPLHSGSSSSSTGGGISLSDSGGGGDGGVARSAGEYESPAISVGIDLVNGRRVPGTGAAGHIRGINATSTGIATINTTNATNTNTNTIGSHAMSKPHAGKIVAVKVMASAKQWRKELEARRSLQTSSTHPPSAHAVSALLSLTSAAAITVTDSAQDLDIREDGYEGRNRGEGGRDNAHFTVR